jgi:predicted RNA-binding Zn ribbon-like protein
VVRAFVNTRDVETDKDEVAAPAAMKGWLVERGLLPNSAAIDGQGVRRLTKMREAVRRLLEVNGGADPDAEATAELNRLAGDVHLVLSFDARGGSSLAPQRGGAEAALARILTIVHTAMHEGTWDRLKVCREDTCLWAFYDHSKNHSRQWCDMAVCGNRNKVQSFRERQKTTTKN